MKKEEFNILRYGKKMLKFTSERLKHAQYLLDESFIEAVELISETKGKIILVGIGKSGIVAKKLSSTLVSIGFLSHYLHPSEALHGDLGIIRENDVIMILSNSGETQELLLFIREVKKLNTNNRIILITSKSKCSLADKSDIVILTHVERETPDKKDELVMVPTVSTMVTLALGDALSFTATKIRGFKVSTLAQSHPGGNIGKIMGS